MLVTVTVNKPDYDTDLGLELQTTYRTVRIKSGNPNGLCSGKGLLVGDEIIAINHTIPRPGMVRTLKGEIVLSVFRLSDCRKELLQLALGERYEISWPERNTCELVVRPSGGNDGSKGRAGYAYQRDGGPNCRQVKSYVVTWKDNGDMEFSLHPKAGLTNDLKQGPQFEGALGAKLYTQEEIELSMVISQINAQVCMERTRALIEATSSKQERRLSAGIA